MAFMFLLAATLTGCGEGYDYSNGERAGTVIKFSNKGLFCKTWEGTMNLGGMSQNDKGEVVPNTWDFTVRDDSPLIKPIKDALSSGQRTKVTYNQRAIVSPCQTDSGYFVTAVESLK
jgi:hypothetical protein